MKSYIEILVTGRVQGVGYRYFTAKEAKKLGIYGYVKNMPNGDVKIEAEGEDEQLTIFIKKLERGPAFSSVLNVNCKYDKLKKNFKEFKVKY